MGSIHNTERRDITARAGEPAKHGERANAYELMHYAITRDESAVVNLNIARKQRSSSNDGLIADVTVMGDVRMVHQEVVTSNNGCTALCRAAMNLAVLANNITIANP